MTWLDELGEHDIIWDRFREGPLAGLTLAKARLINEILWGYPVRVWSVDDLDAKGSWRAQMTPRERQIWRLQHPSGEGRALGEVGIFLGMKLPTGFYNMLEQPFDMKFATSGSFEEGRMYGGSSRHMGLGALGDLEVLTMDPWGFCANCCAWRPRGELRIRDSDPCWADDPGDPYYQDTICRVDCQS